LQKRIVSLSICCSVQKMWASSWVKAHAQDAVQGARRLEAVARAHLGDAQRQLAVAASPD
jgi:hypothetical protein